MSKQNFTGNLALYSDPQMAIEVLRELKASVSETQREAILALLSGITERDLLFYAVGKYVGCREASAAFCGSAALPSGQEEGA